jgi:hypothetical protein
MAEVLISRRVLLEIFKESGVLRPTVTSYLSIQKSRSIAIVCRQELIVPGIDLHHPLDGTLVP